MKDKTILERVSTNIRDPLQSLYQLKISFLSKEFAPCLLIPRDFFSRRSAICLMKGPILPIRLFLAVTFPSIQLFK